MESSGRAVRKRRRKRVKRKKRRKTSGEKNRAGGRKKAIRPSSVDLFAISSSIELSLGLLFPFSPSSLSRSPLRPLDSSLLNRPIGQEQTAQLSLTLPKTLAASPYAALDSEGAATTAATPAIRPRAARRSTTDALGAGATALADAPASLEARTATVRGRAIEAEIMFVVSLGRATGGGGSCFGGKLRSRG